MSKFSEFVDTVSGGCIYSKYLMINILEFEIEIFAFFQFCFVAKKNFHQVSLLHVVHHGILPLSVWPGARYFPGGHATFFGFINVFVHFFMYSYYMLAALGK